jgi:hypothetical protein
MPQVRVHGRANIAHLLACASFLFWSAPTALAQDRRPWVDPAPTQVAPPSEPQANSEPSSPTPPARLPDAQVDTPPSATRPAVTTPQVSPKVARPNTPRQAAVQVRPSAASTQTRRTSTSSSPKVTQAPRIDRQAEPVRQQQTRTAALRSLPSFNCSYAQTVVEQVICAEPGLAAKDLRMALLYEQRGGSRYRPVDAQQWRWLAAREACGRAPRAMLERCIAQTYDARIAELSGGRW